MPPLGEEVKLEMRFFIIQTPNNDVINRLQENNVFFFLYI